MQRAVLDPRRMLNEELHFMPGFEDDRRPRVLHEAKVPVRPNVRNRSKADLKPARARPRSLPLRRTVAVILVKHEI
jgi:hypothetical protein